MEVPNWMRSDGTVDIELLQQESHHCMIEQNRRDWDQAVELWAAGWTAEPVSDTSEIMAYYWRAPSKKKGFKGRLYHSTGQALNALRRSQRA